MCIALVSFCLENRISIVALSSVFSLISNRLATRLEENYHFFEFADFKFLQVSWLWSPSCLQRLKVWWKEELVEQLPLPVRPGPIAEICSFSTPDI